MRYIPTTPEEEKTMLAAVGVSSTEDLFDSIPQRIRTEGQLPLPAALSEAELIAHMRALSGKNKHGGDYVSFLGAGTYEHLIPAVVNHMTLRGEFLTAYTPYQAEISQGVLQAIFEFQTLIAELTGMDAANASMYDGATALAEACLMACNSTRRTKVLLPKTLHPEWLDVVRLYMASQDIAVVELDYDHDRGILDPQKLAAEGDDAACLVVQYPNFFGALEDMAALADWIHNARGLLVVAADPVSLGLLKSPGEFGADIVVGEGQPFGSPISYGGPGFGFFACSDGKLIRRMPGRIVGETVDVDGRRGFVLTLQTREQHIRREKATSNICSNQALNALAAAVHLSVIGPEGLKDMSYQCLQKTAYLQKKLAAAGFARAFSAPFIREFAVRADVDWAQINQQLLEHGFIGGLDLGSLSPQWQGLWLVAATEARTKADIDRFVDVLGGLCS